MVELHAKGVRIDQSSIERLDPDKGGRRPEICDRGFS